MSHTPITVTLTLTEPKKHSVRYDNKSDDAAISTLYVNKSALTQPWPPRLEIAIKEER